MPARKGGDQALKAKHLIESSKKVTEIGGLDELRKMDSLKETDYETLRKMIVGHFRHQLFSLKLFHAEVTTVADLLPAPKARYPIEVIGTGQSTL